MDASGVRQETRFGGGDMEALIRAHDWARTPLGPAETWSASLQMMVGLLLANRFPLLLWWGPDYISIYNDAYRPVLGTKHPAALGMPVRECWSEIWPILQPLIDTPFRGGPATWMDDLVVEVNRYGYLEETHFTVAHSPVPDQTAPNGIGGVLATVHETTQKIVGERRVLALRDLGLRASEGKTAEAACEIACEVLAGYDRDIPFALIYLIQPDCADAHLVACAGVRPDLSLSPTTLSLAADGASAWPAGEAVATGQDVVVEPLGNRFADVPAGPFADPPRCALVLPIPSNKPGEPAGILIAGVSARLRLDELYRSFLSLVAARIATAIANARAFEDERRRAETLAELDRAKTAFFSNVSHEFRTPLTLMLNPIEELRARAADSGDDRILLDMAHRNALRLQRLVNSLLDFSRIEAGRTEANYEPTDLAALTRDLASAFRSVIEHAGLGLVVEAQALPEPVFVDRDLWEKIVLNLLSNAFKFTFSGEIGVSTGLSPDGRAAQVVVRDSGTGIPPGEIAHLFERFHRVAGARGRSFEGSGIGLALVQELVRLHGGTIRVESEIGRGSVFTISVPLGTAHLPRERIGAASLPAAVTTKADVFVTEAMGWLLAELARKSDRPGIGAVEIGAAPAARPAAGGRVLLADDNTDMREYLKRLLNASSFEIEAVADGEAALDAVRRCAPDLVLADVMMPRLDGFGVLAMLRSEPETRDIPVVLLSARAGEDARLEGLRAGADDYLTKPFNARELVARIDGNIRLARLRRSTESELREREERLQLIINSARDYAIVTANVNGRVTSWNTGAERLLGYSENEIIGRPLALFFTPEDRAAGVPERELARALQDGTAVNERWHVRKDGTRFFASGFTHALVNGGRRGLLAIFRDRTSERDAAQALQAANESLERRVHERTAELAATNRQLLAQIEEREKVEATLRQMQRLEAVGQLTSGIAHDFNNLLTVILAQLQFVSRQVSDPATLRRLAMMDAAAKRGASLTAQLLAFSRRQRLDARAVNLNDAVRGMGELLRSTLGGTARLDIVLAPELWWAMVDQTQLKLAVLNLAINARDAMPAGGALTIATGNVTLGEARSPNDPGPGDYVAIGVSDTGSGMAPEVLEHAFEPFFTTKETGHGSGLGLAQVHGFAKQSGGGVRIETAFGSGTTVTVYFPRAGAGEPSGPEPVLGAEARKEPQRTKPRLLLVDDDSDVREASRQVLEEIGYDVTEAGSGGAALDVVDQGHKFDVVLLDFAMPGMNGVELAREIEARRPGIPVAFATGYADIKAMGEIGRHPTVMKPFMADRLAETLRTAIASGVPASNTQPAPPRTQG